MTADQETMEVAITALAHGGDGIGRVDGQVCFVPYGLPGDQLRVRVTRRAKRALWAEIVEVIDAAPSRCAADCPVFGRCGGCSWLHFAYPAQAEWKCRIVRELLQRLGGIEAAPEWIEDASLRLGYRTRAEFHGDGTALGFYAAESHSIVDIARCPLCHDHLNAALALLREAGVKGAAAVTVNPEGEAAMVWTRFLRRSLRDRFSMANTPQEDGPRFRFVFDGVPIVNGTFSQASLLLNRLLVKTVHAFVGKPVSLLDLYCGNGNLSAGLPQRTQVTGVDQNRAAVQAAREARKAEYRAGDEAVMCKLIKQGDCECILLDPPREGAKTVASAIASCSARAVVYVSCDPATLARDLKVICGGGWRLVRSAVIDLFPNTPHMETVCRLER